MGKIVETRIDNFSGGILEDKRAGWVGSIANGFTTRYFSLTKHFDIFSYPKKLIPYHKTEADETKEYDIVKFIYAPYYETSAYVDDRLYGFGIWQGTIGQKRGWLYVHAALPDASWSIPPDEGGDTGLARDEKVIFYYKDYIYWWSGGDTLNRFYIVTETITAYKSISYDNVAESVHHPADDIAYFFADNVVYSLNGTVWATGLTLPAQFKIVAACPYGNYLAIACVSLLEENPESVVFLWDRDSSLATLTERIDFGKGKIMHLANLNNKLISVMDFYLDSILSLDRPKMIVKQASGTSAITLREIICDDIVAAGSALPDMRVVIDNKLYFPAKLTFNSDSRLGIWVVDEYGNTTLDYIEEEADSYQGIYRLGNQWFIAHSNDGSVNRSDDAATFSTINASIYESLVFNAGDSSLTKQLLGVTVTTEKMPTAGQIVLKYRIDGATSWTTIFTNTTDSSIEHSAVNIESSGAVLPQYKEIEFRVESTGGAVITGLNFKSEIIDKKLY